MKKTINLIILLFINNMSSQTITYDIYQDGVYILSTTNTFYKVTGLQPSTTYSFYIIAKDAAGNKSPISNISTIRTLDKPIVYCLSSGNTTNEYIEKIQFNSINIYVSGNNNGYKDTLMTFDLVKNTTNTIKITPLWFGTKRKEGYSVWIDYNRDGDFTDTGEQVFKKTPTSISTVSGSFIVPLTSISGITKMRISMKYNTVPTTCETFSYGEVEDYTINIK